MQKIIWLILLPAFASAAPPSEAVKAKIAAWTKAEVDKQLSEVKNIPATTVNVSAEILKLDERLEVLQKTAQFYTNIKSRLYKTRMVQMQDEIVKACCPLASSQVFDKEEWYRPRKGKRKKRQGEDGSRPSRQEALGRPWLQQKPPDKKSGN